MDILTENEKVFVETYMKTGNASEALRATGYKDTHPKTLHAYASTIKRRPKIQREIARLEEAKKSDLLLRKDIIDTNEIVTVLASIIKGERYVIDNEEIEGKEITKFKFPSAKDKIEAAKALAMILGLSQPAKKEVKVTHKIEEDMYSDVMKKSMRFIQKKMDTKDVIEVLELPEEA